MQVLFNSEIPSFRTIAHNSKDVQSGVTAATPLWMWSTWMQ